MENSNPGNLFTPAGDGRTIAIISYLTIIGWIIAYVMHGNGKTGLGAYHLRQTILLYIAWLCAWILRSLLISIAFFGVLASTLLVIIDIGLFVLWLIGFIAAINGQQKPIPLIGEKAQEWFRGIR